MHNIMIQRHQFQQRERLRREFYSMRDKEKSSGHYGGHNQNQGGQNNTNNTPNLHQRRNVASSSGVAGGKLGE